MSQLRLSPSRVNDFANCPLLYKYRIIDQLPESPSLDAERGTLVHTVLHDLFESPAALRTVQTATDLLPSRWQQQLETKPELASMVTSEKEWLDRATSLLKTYFDLENPKSQVARHILETGLIPEYKEVSTFMDANEAANLENCTLEHYRSKGWKILNKQKGGNLGACQRTEWTMEKIRDLAQNYKSRKEFKKDHNSVYAIAQKYGWLNDVFANMPKIDTTKWTYDKTKEFANIGSKNTALFPFFIILPSIGLLE
jgi:hypothetical protein